MANWQEELQLKLVEKHGKARGLELANKYGPSFAATYRIDTSIESALTDIEALEKLNATYPLHTRFYTPKENGPLHLRLFQITKPLPLSDVLPILENLDLKVDNENTYKINLTTQQTYWINDFEVIYQQGTLDISHVGDSFQTALTQIINGNIENDGFNKLILGARLSWREVMIIRAYAKYLRQVSFRFSQAYIEKALNQHTLITQQLIKLFLTAHDPQKNKDKDTISTLEKVILNALDKVVSLDEDRILRRMFELIQATLRTNYFQNKSYLSLKFNSRSIPELPLPIPLYEIFVYSPHFEGIHLRNSKVARGGIRWSNRLEDFRTEILGLMKAQTVKNAVIVPSGAKGGFVLKNQTDVVSCYKLFISGLLDLTDNLENHKSVHPPKVVCYDESDPYLVVAADKGTATFSDIANGLSKEYNFWLGDAFASGGSSGYDHKKMGITARGAWESIKRHFRELKKDVFTTPFTVVGIGDMSGDVFGNGLLYTPQIKLVAAFDHRHIFIDPQPDPAVSYAERMRLFKLPRSSWVDYQPHLISTGGGVFSRELKSIVITPEMKQILQLEEDALTPNELIRAILKAPVELLFNGGIGTYVKSSRETHAQVGDRTNDYTRINGDELRCKVVGEGGNLGFTQLGRVEYALKGGLINTDFIDNSAGVDCSDHEVNLKILLNAEIQQGNLNEIDRNKLLSSLTDEVAALVLKDNFHQALILSYATNRSASNMGLHINYIKELETIGLLNRHVEFLPDDKELMERKAQGLGLTTPELAVLLAYTKIHIKQEILKTNLLEDPYLRKIIETAFPPSIRDRYQSAMLHHSLQKEIMATQLSNQVVNELGITFVYRLEEETGASIADIIRAYAVAAEVFKTRELELLIDSLDCKISMPDQFEMFYHIRNLINLSTRWFLHYDRFKSDLQKTINHYNQGITRLEHLIPSLMGGNTKEYLQSLINKFESVGLSKDIAHRIATYRAIYTSLNIIEVATENNFNLEKTARVYFACGERMHLLWFRDQIANDSREGHWNTLARLTLRDELDISQRALTVTIITGNPNETDPQHLLNEWLVANDHALKRWEHILERIYSSSNMEYTMYFIAIRELIGLIMMIRQKQQDVSHIQ